MTNPYEHKYIYVFPTMFYTSLTNSTIGLEKVVKWTKNVNLGETEQVFFPINVDGIHWILMGEMGSIINICFF